MLKNDLKMSHGDANTVVHYVRQIDEAKAGGTGGGDDPLDAIYSGAKAALRPIHEKLMMAINKFGDFEIVPKKANVSLRRKKQFALIVATSMRFEVGINMKAVAATNRLLAMPERDVPIQGQSHVRIGSRCRVNRLDTQSV